MPPNPGTEGKSLAVPGAMFSRHRNSGQTENRMSGVVHATGEDRMMALRIISPQGVGMDKPQILAAKIEAALRPPFALGAHQHSLGASLGLALFRGEEQAIDSLLRQADQAMYAIKRARQGVGLAAESLQEI